MATIVKFYKDGRNVKDITSIGYLPVDEDAVKDSRHLASSGSVIAAAALGEESMMANLPIGANTLRFSFGDLDYDPTVAGVGSSGTWTKKNTKFTNVWDWTNEDTDWHEAFKGAFPDESNEVSVIAAGDTSSVTNITKMFAGVYTSKPVQGGYSVTLRNNIVKCVAFDVSNISKMNAMFTASNLKSVVYFDFSNNDSNCECDYLFADTLIEEVGDIYFKVKCLTGVFSRCIMLKKVGVLNIDKDIHSPTSNTTFFYRCTKLEEIGGIIGTSTVQKFVSMFLQCRNLKKIGGSLDCSSATTLGSCFGACNSLEELPEFIGLGTSNITDVSSMFNGCYKLPEVPLFDTSHATTVSSMLSSCYEITEIPNYDFSSVMNVNSFAQSTYKVKEGILETYDKFLDRGESIASHTDTFLDCGRDTKEGRAALAQIPTSWGGTMAEEP